MKEVSKYRNRLIGIVVLGVLIWLIFGILSRIGIFWFGIDFGFELGVRRVFGIIGLTFLLLSIIFSLIALVAYREHFPRWNRDFKVINDSYKKLDSFRKVVGWILIFWTLVNVIVFIIPLYIFMLTDRLFYDFELFNTISVVIIIVVLVIAFIPIKKGSNQKKEKEEIK